LLECNRYVLHQGGRDGKAGASCYVGEADSYNTIILGVYDDPSTLHGYLDPVTSCRLANRVLRTTERFLWLQGQNWFISSDNETGHPILQAIAEQLGLRLHQVDCPPGGEQLPIG
jgi:hypothetical protein